MKKIKILSKFITILSASFLICSNFNAMEDIKKNLKTLKTNNINTNANENNSKNKKTYKICKKDIMKNSFEKDIPTEAQKYDENKDTLIEKQNPNYNKNNNVNLLNKKRYNDNSANDSDNAQHINDNPINNNISYDKQKPNDYIEKQNSNDNKNNQLKRLNKKRNNPRSSNKNKNYFKKLLPINNNNNNMSYDKQKLDNYLENFCIPFPEYFNRITNDSVFDNIDSSQFIPNTDKINEEIQTNEDLKKNRDYIVNHIDKYINFFKKRNLYTFNLNKFVENCLAELNEYDIHNTYLQTESFYYNKLLYYIFFAKHVSSILSVIENDSSIIMEDKIKIVNLQKLISNYIANLKNISNNLEEYFKKLYDDGLDSKYIADLSLNMIKYCLGMLTTVQEKDADKKLIDTYNSICYTDEKLLESDFNENKIGYVYSEGGLHNSLYTYLVSFISYLDYEINYLNKKIYSNKNIKSAPTLIKRLYLIIENFEKILNFEMTIFDNCEKYINDYVKNIKERLELHTPEFLPHIQDAKTYNNFVKDTSTHYKKMIAKLKEQLKKQYLECEKPKNMPLNIKIKNDESLSDFPPNLNNVNVNDQKSYNFNISSNNLNSYDNIKFSDKNLNIPNNQISRNISNLQQLNNLNDVEFDQRENAGLHLRDTDEQRYSSDNLLFYFNNSYEEDYNNMSNLQLNNLNDVKSSEQQKDDSLDLPLDDKATSQLNNFNLNQTSLLNQQSNYDNNNNNIISPINTINNPNNPIYNNMSNLQLNNLNDVKSSEQQKDDGLKNNSLDLLLDDKATSQLNGLNSNQKPPLNQQLSDTDMIPISNDYVFYYMLLNNSEDYDDNISDSQLNNPNDVKSAEQQKYNNNIKSSDNKLNNTNNQISHNMANLQQLNNPNDVKSDKQKNIKKNLFNPLKYEKYDLHDLKKVTKFSLDEKDDANQIDEKMKTFDQMNEDFSTINLAEWLNKQSFNKIYEKLINNFNYFFKYLKKTYFKIKDFEENNHLNLKYLKFMKNSKTSMQLYDYYNVLYSLSVVLDILVSLSDNYCDLCNLSNEISNNELNMNDKIDEIQIKSLKEKLIPLITEMKKRIKSIANSFHNIVEKELPLEKFYSIKDFLDKISTDNGKILKEEILDKSIINKIKRPQILNIYKYKKRITNDKKNKILKKIYEKNEKYKLFLQNRLKLIYLEKSLKFKKNFLLEDVINKKFPDLLKDVNIKKYCEENNLERLNKFITKFLKKETNKFLQIFYNSPQKIDETKTYKTIKEDFIEANMKHYATKNKNNFDELYDSYKKLEKNKQKIKNNQNIKMIKT